MSFPDDTRALFPLPLTPFEHYMLCDDRPAYPMAFVIRYELSGRLDRGALAAAFEEAVERHPLLVCVAERRAGRLRWRLPATLRLPDVDELDASSDRWNDCRVDPWSGTGVRLAVQPRREGDDLLLRFHHACTDGIGAIQFAGDVLGCYAQRTSSDRVRMQSLDATRLLQRGVFERVTSDAPPVGAWDAMRGFAREAAKALSRVPRPLRLAERRPHAGEPLPANTARFDAYHAVELDLEQARIVRQAATAAGVSANDLLLRDLFLAIHRWNRLHGETSTSGWLRVCVPTNLRSGLHDAIPAANVLGYGLLTAAMSDCERPAELLAQLDHDMRAIHRYKLGAMFVDGIAAARRFPGAVALSARTMRRMSTAVFSNVGDFTRRFTCRLPRHEGRVVAGDVVVERMVAAPPLRPQTNLAILLTAYAGRLQLTHWVNPLVHDTAAARDFAAHFLQCVADEAMASDGRCLGART